MFYNNYFILKYAIHIIITVFKIPGYYCSILGSIFIGHNKYTVPRRGKMIMFTNPRNCTEEKHAFPLQNTFIQYHNKILHENIINNPTIKNYFVPRIVDFDILNIYQKGIMNHLFCCQYVITFGKRKNNCIMKHCSCITYVNILSII